MNNKLQTNKIRKIIKNNVILDDLSISKIEFQLQQLEYVVRENQSLKDDVRSARSVYEGLLDKVINYEEAIDKAIKFIEDDYYSKNTTSLDKIGYTCNKLLKVREILKGVKDE